MKGLIVMTLSIVLLSCDDSNDPKRQLSTFSADLNGERWSGNTEIQDDGLTDSLTILGIIQKPQGVVWMRIKFQGIGQYSLTQHAGGYYSTIGLDVLTSEYRFDPKNTGNLLITEYNPQKRSVKGTFEMELEKTYSNPDTAVDILNFRNGTFEGIIPPQ